MAKKKHKLWFSQKQKDSRTSERNSPDRKTPFGILEDGSIVEYTEATAVGSDSSCDWDDAKLLGIGNYHHSE